MARLRQRPCRRRYRSRMASDAERQLSLPSMPFGNRCARSPARSGQRQSIPKLLTAAERLQYEGYLRREETDATILGLSKGGTPIKQIVRQTGHSRKLVRQVIRGECHDVFRTRENSLDQHLPWLDDQWAAGCRNGAELWRRLRARGFRGSLRVVGEWATRRRQAGKVDV